MAASIKHKFVSPVGDGSDTSQVRPSNWNEEHELSGIVLSINNASPDVAGNVALNLDGKTKSVNGVSPDLAGNITINVDGKVKTVNGVSPDINGNITISFTLPAKYEFLARKSANQAIAATTSTKLAYSVLDIGNASYYSTVNGRFTAPEAGLYCFHVAAGMTSSATGRLTLYKNGIAMNVRIADHPARSMDMYRGTIILQLAVNDYVEAWALLDAAVTSDVDCSYFMGHRLT